MLFRLYGVQVDDPGPELPPVDLLRLLTELSKLFIGGPVHHLVRVKYLILLFLVLGHPGQ